MDFKTRCDKLKQIYAAYDAFIAGVDRACRKHCAACCTCNVTATTLEGWLVFDRLRSGAGDPAAFLENLSIQARPDTAPQKRFQPKMTLNEMVALCIQGRDLPEEQNDPMAGSCPLLADESCSIYAVRPFGCRAMLSTVECTEGAEAHMPALVLSANNIVMQYLEALDRPGASGNLLDILFFLSDPQQLRTYENGQCGRFPRPLRPNQPCPALMIPPEHRAAVQPLLQALK